MRPRIKTLPAPCKDPTLAPVPVMRRATYWETTRPLGPQSQQTGPRKSVSPPHKRLQFRDLQTCSHSPFVEVSPVPALHVVLSPHKLDKEFPIHLAEDAEMTAVLCEIDDIIATCRPVLRVRSNSELKSALKKAKQLLGEVQSDRRKMRVVRGAAVSESSRMLRVKGRKSLDSKDLGESRGSPSTQVLRTESSELSFSGKSRHKSQPRERLEAAMDWYSPTKMKPVGVLKSPGAVIYLARATRPQSSCKRVIRRLDKLQPDTSLSEAR